MGSSLAGLPTLLGPNAPLQNASERLAEQKAASFLRAIGMPEVAKSRPTVSANTTITLTYDGQATLKVDPRQGFVVDFIRSGSNRSGQNTSTSLTLRSESDVRRAALRLKKALSLPASYELEGVHFMEGAMASSSFSPRPGGFGFFSRGVQIRMTISPRGGRLMANHREDNVRIESSKVGVTTKQAKKAATAILGQKLGGKIELTEPKLGYTLPNGAFLGIRYPEVEPYRLRLAYEFWVKNKAGVRIWVDAANGKILGGSEYGHKSKS